MWPLLYGPKQIDKLPPFLRIYFTLWKHRLSQCHTVTENLMGFHEEPIWQVAVSAQIGLIII